MTKIIKWPFPDVILRSRREPIDAITEADIKAWMFWNKVSILGDDTKNQKEALGTYDIQTKTIILIQEILDMWYDDFKKDTWREYDWDKDLLLCKLEEEMMLQSHAVLNSIDLLEWDESLDIEFDEDYVLWMLWFILHEYRYKAFDILKKADKIRE